MSRIGLAPSSSRRDDDERVKLTCDLTRYDNRCVGGSLGTTCKSHRSMGDGFVKVRFDSGAYLDILWKSLEVIPKFTPEQLKREQDFTRDVQNLMEQHLQAASIGAYEDRVSEVGLWPRTFKTRAVAGVVVDAELDVVAVCPSVDAARTVQKLLEFALENYPFEKLP